ncbi:MAG TPA: hypothetical protein VIB08_03750 [Thermoanaerobaculia bacterium]
MRSVRRFALLPSVLLSAVLLADGDDARQKSLEYQRKALDAYKRQDWPAFLENSRQAEALRPGVPRLVYNLACAEARNGHAAEAAKLLESLLDRKIDMGSGEDEDFAAVRDSESFAGVRRRLADLRRPVGSSTVVFRIPEKDLLTEGIAWDARSGSFFVSSVRHRKIVRRTKEGALSDFVPEGRDGLQSVLALLVDGKRGLLWACSAALPQMRGYEKSQEGASAVFAFEIATGRLSKRHAFPSDGKPHAANDLALAANGDLYVSDSLGSGIYRLRAGAAALEEFVAPGVFRSPQGLGFGPGGRLYVADWVTGLYWLDSEGKRRDVAGPEDVPLLGIDALVASGGALVVTQNGIAPHRVVRLDLDAAGDRVVAGKILDMNDPEFVEPTLGVVVGGDFCFLGASQWALFDEKTGAADAAKLRDPVLLKVAIGR